MRRLRHALGRVFQLLLTAVYEDREVLPLERFGTRYGGWWCSPGMLGPRQVALCAGAGEDVSFDVALNAKFGMKVLCVDPTPRAISHVAGLLDAAATGRPYAVEGGAERYVLAGFDPGRFDAIPAALWGQDGSLRLYAPQDPAHVSHSALNLQHTTEYIDVPARSMATLLAERGIDRLALLKLDIEGAEYAVIDAMLDGGLRPTQVLIEFDELHLPLSPLAVLRVGRRVRRMRAAGYALVATERANFVFARRAALAEPA